MKSFTILADQLKAIGWPAEDCEQIRRVSPLVDASLNHLMKQGFHHSFPNQNPDLAALSKAVSDIVEN